LGGHGTLSLSIPCSEVSSSCSQSLGVAVGVRVRRLEAGWRFEAGVGVRVEVRFGNVEVRLQDLGVGL
jgi:hypothetical protein